MALNIEFKSKQVRMLDKSLLDPSSDLADDSEGSEIPEPDTSNPDPIDTDITDPVKEICTKIFIRMMIQILLTPGFIEMTRK